MGIASDRVIFCCICMQYTLLERRPGFSRSFKLFRFVSLDLREIVDFLETWGVGFLGCWKEIYQSASADSKLWRPRFPPLRSLSLANAVFWPRQIPDQTSIRVAADKVRIASRVSGTILAHLPSSGKYNTVGNSIPRMGQEEAGGD